MNDTMKNTVKQVLKLAVILIPFATVGGYFTGKYAYASYTAEMKQMLLEQIGSIQTLALVAMIQSVLYAVFCTIVGGILAGVVGLLKPFVYEKDKFIKVLFITLIMGVLFSLDYWVFGACIPQVAASYESGLLYKNVDNWIASVCYGGIVEELMLRLFMMSLMAFLIWQLCFRKYMKEELPTKVFVIANVICALLFAAGHIPATVMMFGELSAIILLRCFLLNGVLGFAFGELYRKYGIQYAFIGHAGTHIISKLIWLIFI